MKAIGFGEPILDRVAQGIPIGSNAIRGREQDLIDAYGGIGAPRLANSINGISPYNPNGWLFYKPASKAYFGTIDPSSLRR